MFTMYKPYELEAPPKAIGVAAVDWKEDGVPT